MIRAILFDLDGTLLDLDMDVFIENYFRLMVEMARHRGMPYEDLPKKVMIATDAMIRDKDPNRTNKEVFDSVFYEIYDADPKATAEFIDDFYRDAFPRLSVLAAPMPRATDVVAKAFEQGLKVAVATNAVFPYSAVNERLKWAQCHDFPYELVTTYENMHFCKPHHEYYLEVCRILKVDPRECLMVGNDVAEDLVAGEVGMKTFLCRERVINEGTRHIKPTYEGDMAVLYQLLTQI